MNYKVVAVLFCIVSSLIGKQFSNPEQIQSQLERVTVFDKEVNDKTLKFITYNIQLSGLDTIPHLWSERKYAVCKLLSYADIFALQEISHEQLLDIKNLLPDFTIVGINTVTGKNLEEPAPGYQEGLAIGFRKDVFSLISNAMTWYSDTPEVPSQQWGVWVSAFPKALQKVTVKCLLNNKEIDIFNSHFAHDEDPEGAINPRLLSSKLELDILKQSKDRYWISSGDRNFHYPRDLEAYGLYSHADAVCDSRKNACNWGTKTTFLGYEDHPRINPVTSDGDFQKEYYLDVVFHNPYMIQSTLWVSHIGEYDGDTLQLLPINRVQQLDKRLFASDHTAIIVIFSLHQF